MPTIPLGVSSQDSLAMTTLLSLGHDLNLHGPLPSGHGIKKPVSIARSGRTQVALLDPKGQSHGGPLMPNISDWHSGAVVCSLWQVLVRGSIPERFFLSSEACAGILRRAARRGKALPRLLMRALTAVASQGRTAPVEDTSCPPFQEILG